MNLKLTPHERRALHRLAAAGVPGRTLAAAFSITPQAVSQIKKGRWDGHGGSNIRGVSRPYTPARDVVWSHA